MDRDTKIGLVLALAFVGLVGAVLYHKMENPETLHAVTPPGLLAQGTTFDPTPPPVPPQEQLPVQEPPAKSAGAEPPPPAPPMNQFPPAVPTTSQSRQEWFIVPPTSPAPKEPPPPAPPGNQAGSGRIVINTGQAPAPQPRKSSSWWPWTKTDKSAVAKNDSPVSPPPAPPVAKREEKPAHVAPVQPKPQAPVAKKESSGWFHLPHFDKKKEPAKPSGLTFDQPPPLFPPSKSEPPPKKKQDVVLATPPKQDSGFLPPGPPSGPPDPTPPVMTFPEKKPDVVLSPPSTPPQRQAEVSPGPPSFTLPETKPGLPPGPPALTPPDRKVEGPLFPPFTVRENRTPPSVPSFAPPVQEAPVVRNTPPKKDLPTNPPLNSEPPALEPPIVRRDPTPPAPLPVEQPKYPPATPVAQQRDTRPAIPVENVRPTPPTNLGERHSPPSATLGRPQDDKNAVASNTTPANTVSSGGGQPVRIRMQPDLPPARDGIPVITRPGAVITKEYPRPSVPVTSTEIRSYTPKQGETYATLSRLFYGHEKYEAALSQFNKERNPRLASVWPGERIYFPSDKEYLERKYPALIGTAAPRSPLDASGPTSRYLPPGDIQTTEARVNQPPQNPITPSGRIRINPPLKAEGAIATPPLDKGVPGEMGNLRYRVRDKDSLWSIAQKTLGKGDRWTEIFALNKEVVRDPNQPEVGLLLKLPADAKVDTAATKE